MIVTAGAVNRSLYFYIQEDAGAANPGEPVTGLLFSSLDSASYARQGAARVAITLATLASASAAHADGGFILVDDTNMPGLYRLDVQDAAFVTGVDQVVVQIDPGAARVCAPVLVDITDVDFRDSVRAGMTALPNAAADAAGGVPISDLGGLDLDGLNTNINDIETDTNELQGDWVNGGRLDLLLDAIPTTAMRGTDSAALASVCTEARLAELAAANLPSDVDAILADTNELQGDWVNGGRLDLLLDAIPTTAMRGTDSAALASVATEARLAELDAANLPTDVDAILVDTNSLNDTKIPDTLSLANINAEVDTALIDAGLVLQVTTITGLVSQTVFNLTAGSADNDPYIGCLAVITDVATGTQKALGIISDYVGATKTVTLREDPGIFVMANTDKIAIVAVPKDVLDILADVTGLAGAAMRGTDSAALASVATEARLAELDTANLPSDVDAILLDTGTTLDTKMNDLQGATFVEVTDSNEAIRNKIDGGVDIAASGIGASSFAAGAIDSAAIATDAIDAAALKADAIDKIWAKICEDQGSRTAQQIMSILLSALAGVTNTSGRIMLDPSGTSTRITGTVNASNERTAITLAPSAGA